MARTQTGPKCTCSSGPLLRVSVGLVCVRAILFESGSKCAAKVVALSIAKSRAFYLNSTKRDYSCKREREMLMYYLLWYPRF